MQMQIQPPALNLTKEWQTHDIISDFMSLQYFKVYLQKHSAWSQELNKFPDGYKNIQAHMARVSKLALGFFWQNYWATINVVSFSFLHSPQLLK
jgi:hypothetical protein